MLARLVAASSSGKAAAPKRPMSSQSTSQATSPKIKRERNVEGVTDTKSVMDDISFVCTPPLCSVGPSNLGYLTTMPSNSSNVVDVSKGTENIESDEEYEALQTQLSSLQKIHQQEIDHISEKRQAQKQKEKEVLRVKITEASRQIQELRSKDSLYSVSDTPRTSATEELKKEKYDISKKGLCLIINCFAEDREGSSKDVAPLKAFWKSVDCEIRVKKNRTKEEVVKILTKCHDDLNSSKYSYFVCVVSSYGNEKGIFTKDGGLITLQEIMDKFKNDNMPKFCGKPKIFLVQACRCGPDDCHDSSVTVPTDADVLLAWATTPGYVAKRHRIEGSWFLQELAKHLHQYHKKEDLEEILKSVRRAVGHRGTGQGYKVIPCTWSTLTKQFYIHKTN